jgi:hypothetical protein
MTAKLLWFMISFVGIMASVPAIALLLILIFRPNINGFLSHHSLAAGVLFALYGMFVSVMFFWLQDLFIVFKPAAGTAPLSKTEVVNRLEKALGTPVEGKSIIDFMKTDDKMIITWSSSVDYFQVTNAGAKNMKRVIVLTFDEKNHTAYFLMKDKDWKWNISKDRFHFSLNYSLGIFAEYQTEIYPSVEYSENGRIRADMKRLTYNSNDLWNPVQTAALSAGWTLRGGMIPEFSHRLLFSLPIALVFFGMALFVTSLHPRSAYDTGATAVKGQGQEGQSDVETQLEKALPYLTNETIELSLDGIMRTPKQYISQDLRKAFVAYSNGYLARQDGKDDFKLKLRSFAQENGIEGLR